MAVKKETDGNWKYMTAQCEKSNLPRRGFSKHRSLKSLVDAIMLFGRWLRCGGGDTDAEWKAFRKEDVDRNEVTEGEGQWESKLGLMAGLMVFQLSAFGLFPGPARSTGADRPAQEPAGFIEDKPGCSGTEF